MGRRKANTEARKAMQYTQPKMVRVINGAKGGRGVMIVEEPSQRDKDRAHG